MRSAVVSAGHEAPACVDDGRRRVKAVCIASFKKVYGELEAIANYRSTSATGMEGLKYVYLNSEKSVALHLESVRSSRAEAWPIRRSSNMVRHGTALGMVPAVRRHGLGWVR